MQKEIIALTKNWKALLPRVALSASIGIWLLTISIDIFDTLSLLFSLFILSYGIFEITFSILGRKAMAGYGGVPDGEHFWIQRTFVPFLNPFFSLIYLNRGDRLILCNVQTLTDLKNDLDQWDKNMLPV